MKKSILFIIEKGVINQRAYFGSSNDLLLISEALRTGLEVYVATPQDIADNSESFSSFPAMKLSNLNQEKVAEEIKNAWKKQVINAILALRFDDEDEEKKKSGILFENAQRQNINLLNIPIFNRAEPISLTDEFYKILISLEKSGARILPSPFLNYHLGDKLAVYGIHYNSPADGINLMDGINISDGANKISFESHFIKISNNDLNANQTKQFYDFLIAKDFEKAAEIFPKEYEILEKGIGEYLEFHKKLGNDSVIKPARYFGGTGVVVVQNQVLDRNDAIQNICQSFLAIYEDCKNSHHLELAFLPEIIVQERARHAHLGDLRIVLCGDNLQGIFVRVNPDFEKSKANNLHFGGHPESLFKSYEISKQGIDLMVGDMVKDEDLKKAKALYGLLKIIDFLKQIKLLKLYPIIGVDALLTEDSQGNYKYGINEINLTSPMGQVQLIILQIAVKFNALVLDILRQEGLVINLEKQQILADYFKNSDGEMIVKAKEILLQDQKLQDLIEAEIDELLKNNLSNQTLDLIMNQSS